MNNQLILVALISLLIGGIGGFGVAQMSDERHQFEIGDMGMMGQDTKGDREETSKTGMHKMPDGSMMQNNMGMMGGMDQMDMIVKSEREFLDGMIPHHEEAVSTAKEIIARGGTTPEIKKLAEGIVTAQEAEIASMKTWYKNWYGEDYVDKGTYKPMMRQLLTLNAKVLDKTFLEDMVMHHMGAIMMAQSVTPYIEHPEITTLTKAIITGQTAEIELMRKLLKDL